MQTTTAAPTEASATPVTTVTARRYVTTSIPYVNAAPHIGFAMELTQADVLARFYRLRGDDVRFQAGSDENSLKNVQAAEAAGRTVADLVAENAGRFQALKGVLDLSTDAFIRTSTDPGHRAGVARLWAACAARGDIYKRAYRGRYCVGCEQFYKAAELADGRCPEHGTVPETVAEENYFFRLSRYGPRLRRAIASGALAIVPEHRRNEALAWIDAGLEDFSISRSAARARGWGLPVPGDPSQVIYVWFDALGNYVTALDYVGDGAPLKRYWHGASSREHVIGKGILRFHAIYWPAMLLSAGLPLPSRVLVHGYLTVDGRKIGKSAGNSVDPVPLARAFGADALRYYLLRHVRATADGDFSEVRLRQAYASELAGQLGNLVHRTTSMLARYCDGTVPAPTADDADLHTATDGLPAVVSGHIEAFAFDAALAAIWQAVAAANKHLAARQPWALAKRGEQAAVDACLGEAAAALVVIGRCLAPLLPATSHAMLDQLGTAPGARIQSGPLLFPPPD